MGRFQRPASLKPSALSISTGPTSPASPLAPESVQHPTIKMAKLSPLPPNEDTIMTDLPLHHPMPWLWSCHKCHATYPLGATRRCLHDGHYFCGGTSVDPWTGKTRRHKPCGSEFDYTGWEEAGYGRTVATGIPVRHSKKNCHTQCAFPSACHWKAKQEAAAATEKARTTFGFVDPSRLEIEHVTEAAAPSVTSTVKKSTSSYVNRFLKTSEKTIASSQAIAKTLTTIEEEEKERRANISNVPASPATLQKATGSPPTPSASRSRSLSLSASPKQLLNSLTLSYPLIDFSSFRKSLEPRPLNSHSQPADTFGYQEKDITTVDITDTDIELSDYYPQSTPSISTSPTPSNSPATPPSTTPHHPPLSPVKQSWDWNNNTISQKEIGADPVTSITTEERGIVDTNKEWDFPFSLPSSNIDLSDEFEPGSGFYLGADGDDEDDDEEEEPSTEEDDTDDEGGVGLALTRFEDVGVAVGVVDEDEEGGWDGKEEREEMIALWNRGVVDYVVGDVGRK